MKLGQVYVPSKPNSTIDVWDHPVKNNRGFVHNDCEVKIVQSSTMHQLIDKIIVTYDGLEYILSHQGLSSGKVLFFVEGNPSIRCSSTGSGWDIILPTGTSTNTITGLFPPTINWSAVGGNPVTVTYHSNDIDSDGNLIERDIENFNATTNLTNEELLQWEKMTGGGCGVKNKVHYKQGVVEGIILDPVLYRDAVKWAGDPNCGNGMVDSSELLLALSNLRYFRW